jgi:hypothetical protein
LNCLACKSGVRNGRDIVDKLLGLLVLVVFIVVLISVVFGKRRA